MKTSVAWLDDLAKISKENLAIRWLERGAFVFLTLMVVSAPHSIAATQTAWLIGTFLWIVRLFINPRPEFKITALGLALLAFFGWSVITSFTSYAPDISIGRLQGALLFTIFFFVTGNVRTIRAAHFLAFALIASCMVNVLWMPVERLIGRGVEIHGLVPEGPLAKVLLNGDTLLEANGRKLTTPEGLLIEIEQNETTKILFYRPDYYLPVDVKRSDLLAGTTALEKLGVTSWKKSRNWRSSGFYGHYTTYADVLLLIASLVFGLLVTATGFSSSPRLRVSGSPRLLISPIALLLFCMTAMSFALLLTVTRGPQLALAGSCALVVLVGLGRKWFIATAVIGLPVAIAAVLFLQQSRNVGFFDPKDDSTRYRQTMWRDGVRLWTENPRHFVVGVGMDTIQKHWREWGLYNGGNLPMGHFHSTPIQLLVERGLPALLIWLTVLGIYARTLWRGIREEREKAGRGDTETRRSGNAQRTTGHSDLTLSPYPRVPASQINLGILLGCLGGAAGFFASGLVHYNFGDAEVAMVFYLLMGIGVKVADQYISASS